jgi:hypothetical protein
VLRQSRMLGLWRSRIIRQGREPHDHVRVTRVVRRRWGLDGDFRLEGILRGRNAHGAECKTSCACNDCQCPGYQKETPMDKLTWSAVF